jgi:hypothetical protein
VKYFEGYDKGERLKMSRKVLKNWDCPLTHIFKFEAAPNSGKKVEAAPFSHPPPPSHY